MATFIIMPICTVAKNREWLKELNNELTEMLLTALVYFQMDTFVIATHTLTHSNMYTRARNICVPEKKFVRITDSHSTYRLDLVNL